jgi:hypothetical protein
MKTIYLLLFSMMIFIAACSKSNSGKPVISIESINSVIPLNGELDAKLKFTQSNGQLSNGTFTAIRNRLNQQPAANPSADTIVSTIPTFPNESKGEFLFTLDYSYLHESDIENDTIQFKFAVTDNAGNTSDTVTTGQIVILYQ